MQETGEKGAILSQDKQVIRRGDKVERPARPWSSSVFRLLHHLEDAGLPVEHPISLDDRAQITAFAAGEMVHPYKWTDEALYEIGRLTARLHAAVRSFAERDGDRWQPWCLREIGRPAPRILCHGDIAPWNVITQDGQPHVLIDWEYAGPLDPLVELARICWLFPQLVDDDLQALYDLPDPSKRAAQVRLIADGYGLSRAERERLTDQILEVIVCETAHEAIDPAITFEDTGCLWGFAWRTRSLYWVWRHRALIRQALQ